MIDFTPRHWAIIPAAGIGRRMHSDIPKQYLPLVGRTVIEHALKPFLHHPLIAGIVVALDSEDAYWPSLDVQAGKPLMIVAGGAERAHSVLNALRYLEAHTDANDWALVHDAVRPCLVRADLDRLLDSLSNDPVGGILAAPLADTLKRAGAEGAIEATIDRTGLWRALTPQMFRVSDLRQAIERALIANLPITDEAAAIEHSGLRPKLVEGRGDNLKITRAEDLVLADRILSTRPA